MEGASKRKVCQAARRRQRTRVGLWLLQRRRLPGATAAPRLQLGQQRVVLLLAQRILLLLQRPLHTRARAHGGGAGRRGGARAHLLLHGRLQHARGGVALLVAQLGRHCTGRHVTARSRRDGLRTFARRLGADARLQRILRRRLRARPHEPPAHSGGATMGARTAERSAARSTAATLRKSASSCACLASSLPPACARRAATRRSISCDRARR